MTPIKGPSTTGSDGDVQSGWTSPGRPWVVVPLLYPSVYRPPWVHRLPVRYRTPLYCPLYTGYTPRPAERERCLATSATCEPTCG